VVSTADEFDTYKWIYPTIELEALQKIKQVTRKHGYRGFLRESGKVKYSQSLRTTSSKSSKQWRVQGWVKS